MRCPIAVQKPNASICNNKPHGHDHFGCALNATCGLSIAGLERGLPAAGVIIKGELEGLLIQGGLPKQNILMLDR